MNFKVTNIILPIQCKFELLTLAFTLATLASLVLLSLTVFYATLERRVHALTRYSDGRPWLGAF